MIEDFITDLQRIYNELINKNSNGIGDFKEKWKVNKSIGEVYQNLCKNDLKKDMGSFYTPFDIVSYMVEEALRNIDYEKNSYMKILDPSCGGGYFLSEIYKKLKEKGEALGIKNIEQHILANNIYGCDTDENAIMICVLEFFELTGYIAENIVKADFLTNSTGSYDIIIGNPPYMGHKILTGDYREQLYDIYKDVFYDKADLSYCFIKKSIDLLNTNGKLVFFTSRYILEASNGYGIRRYMQKYGLISSIIDFYGVRVIKGVGVDNIIFEFIKGHNTGCTEFYRIMENGKGKGDKIFEDIRNEKFNFTKNIKAYYENLKPSGFVFLSEIENSILSKIKGVMLSSICESYQGIITGCDKAFILSSKEADILNIEKGLLKPWIKGKHIREFEVIRSEEVIIYSDLVDNENMYVNSINQINKYHEKLVNRRECKAKIRKWYQLQWGRNLKLFLDKKIIYPYKASSNRFAIDSGNCFSADVYCIKIGDMFKNTTTYEYLVGILNSSLYEFYIKSIAKKLGDDLYEYYPNKIMTLEIPEYIKEIDLEVKKGGENLRRRIDYILNQYFNISEEEYKVIKSWCRE